MVIKETYADEANEVPEHIVGKVHLVMVMRTLLTNLAYCRQGLKPAGNVL